ncbi:dipeptide/oligopeptide/nickel ABC transporter permease/ATP-binding protein [Agromyces humatus]|uniref:Dipeptide/oligopeptide/nickel ABC transporter permease/ATP-binding protein n=1 Tax=Agromyces humatus TaxID=279573 RepID=A0ABN2KT04_9MICO|nr:dipeptide/oligopeptide/nickel ABC transporter permease/ATP-binding protein [Agromyces humatus]
MTQPVDIDPRAGAMVRSSLVKRIFTNPLGIIAVAILAIMILAATFAALLAPFDQNFADIGNTLAAPGGEHLLGTDSAGRDVWSRLLYGAQLTLLSALLCAAVAIGIGLPAGLIAGYYGGPFDTGASWFTNLLMSLPGIIVLLSARAALGPSVWISMIMFGILISPGYYRLTRTAVQSVRNELYVDAARVAGLGDGRIITRHILSVVRAPLIIQTAMVLGVAIAVQSGLEFLGLGNPAEATWGVMLSDGFRNVYLSPQLFVWPVLAIGLTIGALVLLGNAVRDALEDGQKIAKAKRRATDATGAVAAVDARVPAASDVRTRAVSAALPAVEAGTEHHLLRVSNLGVGYPQADGSVRSVVRNVSFHVDRGEVVGIVGESGSGKSQTAFSILGLLPDTARITGGTIQFDGAYTVAPGDERVSQTRLRALRGRRIAYIPQEPMSNLDPAYRVGSQLVRPMMLVLGISRAEATRRALDLLEKVGIADPKRTFDAYPHEISGGMAQRVLIAGAISCEPDLIIADEPTTALDVTVQAEVLDLLRDMQKELGVGVILVTHNFGVVADLADRVVVMQHGSVVEAGQVRDILRDPRDVYTRTLLDSMLEGKEPMTTLGSSAPAAPVVPTLADAARVGLITDVAATASTETNEAIEEVAR